MTNKANGYRRPFISDDAISSEVMVANFSAEISPHITLLLKSENKSNVKLNAVEMKIPDNDDKNLTAAPSTE